MRHSTCQDSCRHGKAKELGTDYNKSLRVGYIYIIGVPIKYKGEWLYRYLLDLEPG